MWLVVEASRAGLLCSLTVVPRLLIIMPTSRQTLRRVVGGDGLLKPAHLLLGDAEVAERRALTVGATALAGQSGGISMGGDRKLARCLPLLTSGASATGRRPSAPRSRTAASCRMSEDAPWPARSPDPMRVGRCRPVAASWVS